MKNILINLSMKKKFILAFIISALIPQIILGIILFFNLHSIALENAINNTKRNVQDVKNSLSEVLQNAVDISNKLYLDKKLVNILSTPYKNLDQIYEDYSSYNELANLLSIYHQNIYAIKIFAYNQTLLETGEFIKVDENIRKQQWFKNAENENGRILWELVYDDNPIRPQYYFCLTRLLKDSFGERLGVIVIYIKAERINEILAHNENTIILNDRDVILASNNQDIVGKRFSVVPFYREIKRLKEGEMETKDFIAFIGEVSPKESGYSFLKVISFVPKTEIFKEPNNVSIFAFSVVIIDLIVSLLLMLLFAKLITDRLEILNRKVKYISKGDLDTNIEILGNDEIGQLAENVRDMAKSLKNLIDRVYKAEIERQKLIAKQREIQFEMLSSKINPHFLFNTLEAVRMKAICNNQEEISKIIFILSNLLRKSLNSSSDPITIEQEIEFINEYIEIQKFRFGARIKFEMSVDESLYKVKILPFIIQPVVENAIKHGVEPKVGTGYVKLEISSINDAKILIRVTDNGVGMEEQKLSELQKNLLEEQKDSHLGIKNVYKRLMLYYKNEFEFRIESEKNMGTVVEIVLPRR